MILKLNYFNYVKGFKMKKLLLMAFVLLGASQVAAGSIPIEVPQCSFGQSLVCNKLEQSCTCVSLFM